MRRCFFLPLAVTWLLGSAMFAGPKHAALQVMEFKAQREDDLITVHAKVKNASEKALQKVSLVFRFLDSDGGTVTKQRTELNETSLSPGQESEIEAQMKDAPRAVRVLILADRSGTIDVRVGNAGPFAVE